MGDSLGVANGIGDRRCLLQIRPGEGIKGSVPAGKRALGKK
jgi:hypothetical protein